MHEIKIDFSRNDGIMKPMHAVNNGPVYKFAEDQRITNIDHFRAAAIPYARTHDAAFYATYGGEHTVDIHAIFPDFDADPEDPASYDFVCTDEYMKVMVYAGVEPFYRLGSKIEHWPKKYGTLPPKDFHKWAVICEHIIRHYTEGWADGFHYKMTYWEIWNEPDLDPDDSTHKRTWGGTKKQFFELYHIAATHLKKCFPHLKIGGPALAGKMDWAEEFLAQLKAPLDFFSWHVYAKDDEKVLMKIRKVRELLDTYGFKDTESILNEWNYVRGWKGDDWLYSLRMEKALKGSAFIAMVMCLGQREALDMLMYYDARPCGMNGLFSTDFVCDRLKGYYPFYMFNQLYQLGEYTKTEDANNIYSCAAKNGTNAAIMVTHFIDDDETAPKDTLLDISGFSAENGIRAKFYRLSEEEDLEFVKEESFTGETYKIPLNLPNFNSYLVLLEKI